MKDHPNDVPTGPTILTPAEEYAYELLAKNMDAAHSLERKWIASERQYRDQVREAMQAGTPFSAMAAHADQLKECRLQLQREFELTQQPNLSSVA